MTISITVCGQSNSRGQWRNQSDTAGFPLAPWPNSWLCSHPTVPNANDPAVQGTAIWPYVSQLLLKRHGLRVMFWNAAEGSTGLSSDWNGRVMVSGVDAAVGAITLNGTAITSATGGLDAFADGQSIKIRGSTSNDGLKTITGTPSAGEITVTSAFTGSQTSTGIAIHHNSTQYNFGGASFDPNDYYADALASFGKGRFDARYALIMTGNKDFTRRQSLSDVESEINQFVDFWQDAGADGILLGGTLLNGTISGTVYSNGPTFMRDAWRVACDNIIAANEDVYLGAHVSDDVSFSSTGWLKSDNTHFNYLMNLIAAEAWYRAIATMLGYTTSTVGRVYTAIGDGELTYPRTRVA